MPASELHNRSYWRLGSAPVSVRNVHQRLFLVAQQDQIFLKERVDSRKRPLDCQTLPETFHPYPRDRDTWFTTTQTLGVLPTFEDKLRLEGHLY